MNKTPWTFGLLFAISIITIVGTTGCGQRASSQETENLKKEVEALKRDKDAEKANKEKSALADQQDALLKETQKIEEEKKRLAANKQNAAETANAVSMYINSPDGVLYLRSKPSETGDILATGKNDEWADVLQQGKTWSKVRFQGKIGYMGAKYLITPPKD